MRLEVNMRDVPRCDASSNCSAAPEHWSVLGIRRVLGRPLTDADAIRVSLDVPAEMACPFCGGYVRGHLWIGADRCSVSEVFPEPLGEWGLCGRCGQPHACAPSARTF